MKSSNKTDGIQIGTGLIAACENSKQSVAISETSLASPCLSVSANHSFVTNSSSALDSLVSASVCALSTTSVALSASSSISASLPVATSVPSSSSIVSPATIVAASKFLPALTSFFSHQPAQSHKTSFTQTSVQPRIWIKEHLFANVKGVVHEIECGKCFNKQSRHKKSPPPHQQTFQT